MRSLLTLTLAFALLVTYMEIIAPTQAAMVPSTTAKVVRTASTTPTLIATAPKAEAPQPKLNLSLPALDILEQPFNSQQTSKTGIFNPKQDSDKTAVSYNAELVFDAKKGEQVTGGKIHIKIPLS